MHRHCLGGVLVPQQPLLIFFFFRCHDRRILQGILRDIEEICAGVHGYFFFSKQEEKRKVCVDETSRKWVGEAVVMSCCLWQ